MQRKAEKTLGITFPYDLKKFLMEIGYGFLESFEYNINRIMGPASDFKFYPDIEMYEELEEDKLIFFEAN